MTTATGSRLRHILTSSQFDRALVDEILNHAAALDGVRDTRLSGQILATLFFEPSTRTRLSFESAMVRLGGAVIGSEAAGAFSSAAKGESLEDTIRVVDAYADVLVLRHHQVGAAQRAAAVSRVPVINAGDGSGEHPTQALIDLYTIQHERGRLDDMHIFLCGDLRHARTAHSLALIASLYSGVRLTCVAPENLSLPRAVANAARRGGATVTELTELAGTLGDCDVLYQTRLQRERLDEGADTSGRVIVNAELMAQLPADAIVMQPLPRLDDIAPEVDSDPRAAYFRQSANGVAVRMALLEMLLA